MSKKNCHGEDAWVLLAMNTKFFLRVAKRVCRSLRQESEIKRKIHTWFADTANREEICRRIANGPSLVMYLGHGTHLGWSGYRTLHWEHITSYPMERPCGVVISLACETLKSKAGEMSFGEKWIQESRTHAYLGSVEKIKIRYFKVITDAFVRRLAQQDCKTAGDLFAQLHIDFEERPELAEARQDFLNFRLLGNPLQPLQ